MRLFIAVPLPEAVRRRVTAAIATVGADPSAVRWTDAVQLHLTLKFLGDTMADRVPRLADALTTAAQGAKPFEVPVTGFGAFPTLDRPRVLWAGLEPVPPLELLQHRVERAMAAEAYAIEGRPFRPHVTVGRVRRGGERAARAVARRLADVTHHDVFTVSQVILMESVPGPGGPAYHQRHVVPLTG